LLKGDRVNPTLPGDWNQHWIEFADSASLNPAQDYRRQQILAALAQDGAPSRLVDVGSGQGDLAVDLHRAFPQASILGLELSHSGVAIASRKVPSARFLQADLLAEQNPPAEFAGSATHAVCSEVLEHVGDPIKMLRNIQVYLRPGALLVVTVPGGPMSYFDKHIGHLQHFTATRLKALLQESGYKNVKVSRSGFPFFNLYRMVVVARGKALVNDAKPNTDSLGAKVARWVMAIFGVLFKMNWPRSPWGWQLIARAERP
jgi:trans-aconitate methyltransferase